VKLLIVNADDFGLHTAVNEGIITGHNKGCITSTSIMASGRAFDDAVSKAAANPSLGLGVHLTLVAERPVAQPETVPSLVDREGLFAASYPRFINKYLQGKVALADIRRELAAQVEKVIATGLTITHLDSHQHLHVLPGVIDTVLDIAVHYKIKALRIPAEGLLFTGGFPFTAGRIIGRSGLSCLASVARRKAKNRGLMTPNFFFGMLAGGNMQEEYLMNILKKLPTGVSEIMVHPGNDSSLLSRFFGWEYHWQDELAAVTSSSVLSLLAENNIKLVTFRELENG
jgi:hopanoid biosynthesis associated protein HpnK